MATRPESGTVSLTIPATPEYLLLARLALSAVCRLTPLRPDEVADLKLAVTEAAARFVGRREDRLSFSFAVSQDELVLELAGSGDGAAPIPPPDADEELGLSIIEATVDRYERAATGARLVKALESVRR